MSPETLIALLSGIGALIAVLCDKIRASRCRHVDICGGFISVERELETKNPDAASSQAS